MIKQAAGHRPNSHSEANLNAVIKLAILALGGQGGGVLTNWIVALAEHNGYAVQATSVAGVAQRTGATIYYIEMTKARERAPIFALTPTAGDVDIVIAAEMMEAGRAVMRGFVTPAQTTLITSTHRMLATAEKIVPGDGKVDADEVDAAVKLAASRYIAFDMQRIADDHGTVLSASLFGALAGAALLPFAQDSYESTIAASQRGATENLAAFREAAAIAAGDRDPPAITTTPPPLPKIAAHSSWHAHFESLPPLCHDMIWHGLALVVDFQDVAYGRQYLDDLNRVAACDRAAGGVEHGFALTLAAAQYLARAMVYDDVIRVADLKTRRQRFQRIEAEIDSSHADRTIATLTDYLHPTAQEICALMPARLGHKIETHPSMLARLDRLVNRGRRLRTDRLWGFLLLYLLAKLRPLRRHLWRHRVEVAHRQIWLETALQRAHHDYQLGVQTLKARRLIKGYSDTHRRGQSKFDQIMATLALLENRHDAALWGQRLIKAALNDADGTALQGTIKTIHSFAPADDHTKASAPHRDSSESNHNRA